ncbi:hypothetical protein WMW71_11685 [Flavobacterium buctense]|uniref:Uncharacterized protein n=1 Tax=Flavobacterium buctense TaxID=1648146 RepID=A0ABU9E2X2_9FLAO|nr:hypothetical protein [Flavobacterium buctense]
MKVYESTGTFNPSDETFSITIQTTKISPDEFYISQYYNISNASRYAIVGILQTVDKNDTDFSNYPADSQLVLEDVSFSTLDTSYLAPGDKDIYDITTRDQITVYIHHGIGFDPTTNSDDNKYIENYKDGIYVHLAGGSPPGTGAPGGLNG